MIKSKFYFMNKDQGITLIALGFVVEVIDSMGPVPLSLKDKKVLDRLGIPNERNTISEDSYGESYFIDQGYVKDNFHIDFENALRFAIDTSMRHEKNILKFKGINPQMLKLFKIWRIQLEKEHIPMEDFIGHCLGYIDGNLADFLETEVEKWKAPKHLSKLK